MKLNGGLRTNNFKRKKFNSKPLISIITAVYNGEKYLNTTIKSVLNQDYENIEYIIIDGKSTDSTVEIIKSYNDVIDYWVSEKDNGIYDAWNKGIEHATGEIIAFLSADDWYEKNALSLVAEEYIKNSENFIFAARMNMIGENDVCLYTKKSNFSLLNKRMSINHPTAFISSSFYKLKNFDKSFKITGDYEYFLFLYDLSKKEKFNIIISDEIITNMRIDGVSDKITSIIAVIKEDFLLRKKYLPKITAYKLFLLEIVFKLPKKVLKYFIRIKYLKKLMHKYYDKKYH